MGDSVYENSVVDRKGRKVNKPIEIDYQDPNEALLVKQIDVSLSNYMKLCGEKYLSYPPPSTAQNFSNLDKYCGDIVAALGTISALVLEVKYNTNGRLNDLNSTQRSGLIELNTRGLPVFYSYNFNNLKNFPADPSEQLLKISAVIPENQPGKIAIKDESWNLRDAIDRLRKKPPTDNDDVAIALAYFLDFEKSIINSGIEKLTTKTLLIIYDSKTSHLASLSREAASHVVQYIMDEKYQAVNKDAKNLATTINQLLTTWHAQVDSKNTIQDIENPSSSQQFGF